MLVKVWFFSDWHLGFPKANYSAMARALDEARACTYVYFVGDIFELLWNDWPTITTQAPYKQIYDKIAFLLGLRVPKTIFIAGNHDPKPLLDLGLPGVAEAVQEARFNNHLVTHGHRFDYTITSLDKVLGRFYKYLPGLRGRVWGSPWQEKLKGEREKWNTHQAFIAQKAQEWAGKNKAGVIYGHTHLPFQQEFPTLGISLRNCSDMVDSCLGLEFYNGGWSWVDFK